MAIARVNLTSASDWSFTSLPTWASPALSVTAGNTLIVAAGGWATGGQSISSVVDTAGNTYTKVDHVVEAADQFREEIWYAQNILGHATNVVTVTWNSALPFRAIVVLQYSGLAGLAPFDVTAKGTSAPSASTVVTTGSFSTTVADEVHILLSRWGAPGGVPTPPAGFTNISPDANAILYEKVASATYSGTYSLTYGASSHATVNLLGAFKAGAAAPPAIALVASTSAYLGLGGGTTGASDTTGANLLLLGVAWWGGGSGLAVSDSKGNTYVPRTAYGPPSTPARQQFFYCLSPTVGSGHTFTVTGTGIDPSVVVYAFSGVGSYQTESGVGNNGFGGPFPLVTGSVTPSEDRALIVSGVAASNVGGTYSVSPAGFSAVLTQAGGMSESLAYYVQPTAAAINAEWSWTFGHNHMGASTVVFLPAAAETLPDALVSQVVVETLTEIPPIPARVTLLAVELFTPHLTAARATQLAVEVFVPHIVTTRTTQQAVEYFQARAATARLSQEAVEIFLVPVEPPPCPAGDDLFPIDSDVT